MQIVGGLILDYGWPWVRFPSAGIVLEDLRGSPEPPRIVCLGSSRFMAGLPEHQLGALLQEQLGASRPIPVLNAAVNGGDPVSFEFLLDQLLSRGVHPELVIVEVNPESLNSYNTWLYHDVSRQLRWEDTPTYLHDIIRAGLIGKWLKARLLPLRLHHSQICQEAYEGLAWLAAQALGQTAQAPSGVPSEQAHNPLEGVLRTLQEVPHTTPEERTRAGMGIVTGAWLKHYAVGGTATAALDRVVNRCRANGIHVLLVGVPVSLPHRSAYTPEIEAAYQAHMRGMVAAFGCRFVDYRDRIPDELFLDNHHLLWPGGVRFSNMLVREALAPMWREVVEQSPQTPKR